MGTVIHFLLVPDRAAARNVRRAVAEDGPRLGLQVGTWLDLHHAARGAFLLPQPKEVFAERLASATPDLNTAFWSESHRVAPVETEAVLARELERLIRAVGPGKALSDDPPKELSPRAAAHLRDLGTLHRKMGYALPSDLQTLQAILNCEVGAATRSLLVYHVEDFPPLNPWQRALIDKLKGAVASEKDPQLATLLANTLQPAPHAESKTTLYSIQSDLFQPAPKPVKRDDSVQWVGCRDYLEEVEVCAGMIQQGLREKKYASTSDIGLLLPADGDYARAVEAVFARAGLPLSGLVVEESLRDLGAELVRQYLLSLRKPAPIMALAALVTNPLLPWSAEEERALAHRIMKGTFTLKAHSGMGKAAQALIAAVNAGAEKPAQLRKALELLSAHLPESEALEDHSARARACIASSLEALQGTKDIPWAELLARTQPIPLPHSHEGELSREGIAVMQEGEEPWRAVRALFVLGFRDGHFPRDTAGSPVFFEEDLQALNGSLGLELQTPTELQARNRERFRRQLCAASKRLTFLIPRRDGVGGVLTPASSLVYMAQLLEGASEGEDLIWDLDSTEDRAQVQSLALAPQAKPTPPREPLRQDLHLKRNLLEPGENGRPAAHQSPSSLDNLMVSPLAWVLSRYGLESKVWAPQELDPALQGSLAHRVFERLFPVGQPLIEGKKVEGKARQELARAIVEEAPFLQAPEWRVERFNLAHQVGLAALRWRHFLATTKAKVVGLEIRLTGTLDDLPLKGFADSLLQLPGGRLFVVDFKKSASGKRRTRMVKGYDSQAHLYRLMLNTGGKELQPELQALLKSKPEIGIMYFLMNDQVALTDTDNWLGGGIEKLEEMGVDVAAEAMLEIRARLVAVKKGKVALNREEDAKEFAKNGVGTYALEGNPLVSLFTVPTGEEGP